MRETSGFPLMKEARKKCYKNLVILLQAVKKRVATQEAQTQPHAASLPQ
jgi:hypothetical protein